MGSRVAVRRRRFLESTALGLPLIGSASWMQSPSRDRARERSADLVIVGGSVGGCAAAFAACRAGLRVILTEETDWIGGQLTSQAVPPDEHPWIESSAARAATGSFAAAFVTTAITIR